MEEGGGNNRPANKAPAEKKKGVFHGRRVKRKYTRNARTGSEQKTLFVVRAPGNGGSIPTRTPTPRRAYSAKKITKADLANLLRYERQDKIKIVKKSKRFEH